MPPPMKQPAHLNRHRLNTSLAIAHGCFRRITRENYKDTHLKMKRKFGIADTRFGASATAFPPLKLQQKMACSWDK
jgi:hypothetical protein